MGANHPQGFARLRVLQYAERDAELLANALLAPPCSFTQAQHVIADDPRATLRGLDDFLQQPAIQEQDLIVVHFSGHGHFSYRDNKLYLLCNQTEARDFDISSIDIDAIKRRLADCTARYKLLILDCCHSGGATEGILKGAQEVEEELAQALQGSSNVILAACSRAERTRELAKIDDEEGGGVLSWIVRAACSTRLREAGDGRSLSLKDIQRWIPDIIKKINSALPEGEEHIPQPRTFYEEQGGDEIWLTEARRATGRARQDTSIVEHMQTLVASQRDFVEDRVGRFVGREAELAALHKRIDDEMAQGGYVVITGDVGQGKSSIIAKLIEQQGIDTTAYHFVHYNSGDNFRTTLLRKLIAHLILKYDLPYYYFDSESYPTLSGYFARVLAEVAAKNAAQGEREVIYIDGIDQLAQGVNEQGLGFLPARLRPGIVIVVGTRPNDTLKELRAAIGKQNVDDRYKLGALSLDDFELLLPPRDELLPALVQRLYQAMQGNALYLDLLAQELKASHDIRPEELIAHIENNPDGIFTLTFQRIKEQSETNWDSVIRPMLGTLLVAQEALTRQQIARICPAEGHLIRNGITRLGGLLTNLSHERHALFHSKLYEYLRQHADHPDEEYEFSLEDVRQCHQKMARWCGQWTSEQLWSEGIDPPDRADDREYARKHYVAHLHHASDYPALFNVLDEGEYERGKLQADPSTRSTVLDLIWGCKDAADTVMSRAGASPAASLGALARLWRYTLLRCSLATQADTYPIEAFQALLALDRERQALDLAELLTQPMNKLFALTLVMQWLLALPERMTEGLQLYDRGYDVAALITNKREQVRAFGHLAASLQQARQEEKASECWQAANEVADSITDSDERAGALRNLAEAYIQANMWDQAETIARMIDTPIEQIEVWGHLLLSLRRAGLIARADAVSSEIQTLMSGNTEQQALQNRANSMFALALAQVGQAEEAREVAGRVRDSAERDVTFVRVAAELAIIDAALWENNWYDIEEMVEKYSGRPLPSLNYALVDLATELARQERWEQAQAVVKALSNKEARCRALMGIVSQLASHGQSEEAEERWKEARALCTAQIDQVEARVAGIIASALVKAGRVKQAREFVDGIPDDHIQTRERAMSEFASALATTGQIDDARKTTNNIINLQDKDNALSNIALALMKAGESEQAQAIARSIDDRRQRRRILDELVTICCNNQQWGAVQTTVALIDDDPTLQATARGRIISALVKAGQASQAEAIVRAMPRNYSRFRATCDLATAFAQIGDEKNANKYIRTLNGNEAIQARARCNRDLADLAIKWMDYEWSIDQVRSKAEAISEGDERREALRDVAIAYAHAQLWGKAQAVVEMINDEEKQDEAREILAIELARAGQWERAITTLNVIRKNRNPQRDRRTVILQAWGTRLAQAEKSEQRETIARYLNDPGERACLLVSVADTLAQAGQYTELLHVIQQAWLQAGTKDDCLNLFAAVQGLILLDPEASIAFYDAFTWVNTFLSE
jgi:hypothetical protein